jgi:hypothetical protein
MPAAFSANTAVETIFVEKKNFFFETLADQNFNIIIL